MRTVSLDGFRSGVVCYSCGVLRDYYNIDERCDLAHREEWKHEWVVNVPNRDVTTADDKDE